jgi:adenylate cyclase
MMMTFTNRSGRKILQGAAIGLAAALIGLGVWSAGWLETWEAETWDWRARVLAQPGAATSEIVLVLLDQNSLDWAARENGLTWPWPREIYGAVVEFCRMAGARALAFDVLYTEASTYGVEDDRLFGAAVDAYGKVALPVFLGAASGALRKWPDPVPDPRFTVSGLDRWLARNGGDAGDYPRAAFPVPELARSAAVLCNVHMTPDSDGIYRRVPLFGRFDGRLLPALGLGPFFAAHPGTGLQLEKGGLTVGSHFAPVDGRGRALLRFRGPSGTHQSFSAAAVLQSYLRIQNGETPPVRPDELKGKYVLFGFSAPGLFDLRPAPVDGVYPGVEIHATLLDNLLSGDLPAPFPAGAAAVLAVVFSLGAAVTASVFSTAAGGAAVGAAAVGVPVALSLWVYRLGYWMPVAVLVVAAVLSVLISMAVNYATEGRQKRFIKNAFRQYLSPAVIEELIRSPDRLKLGGERRVLSIFFSDLQGFTSISEGLEPEALTALLNDYLSAMTDIIQEEGGTVDKYEGDAIIAFWNAPLDLPDHAVRVVRAALRCQDALAELRPLFFERIGKEMFMRIGINTGPAVVGNLGSRTRFDYTMLGDAVNLAARLEGVNKQFGTYTMISSDTRAQMGEEFAARELARVAVVGKKKPVTVFEPMWPSAYQERRRVLSVFAEARALFYAGRFFEAAAAFADIEEKDPPAARYRLKCRELAAAPPEKWEGVWVMTSK